MPRIAIVTDSTACLPADTAARLGIGVVPLQVVIKGESYSEADPMTSKLLVETLRGHGTATTSRPSPEEFTAAYRAAFEAGYDGVVSLHISGELSATVEAAELAAKDAPLPVRVIDSRTAAMALGFAALAACSAGSVESAEMSAVVEVAETRCAASSAFFYVDTLEFLRRGGRIGSARALLGSALAMKPLLHIVHGRVEPLEKVRTATKAIARLEEIAVECAVAGGGDGSNVDIAVQHLDAEVRAGMLADRLRDRLPGLRDVAVSEVGAVIGAHVGPGVIGVIVSIR